MRGWGDVAFIGQEGEPLATLEAFAADPMRCAPQRWRRRSRLRTSIIRAPRPPGYLAEQLPVIAKAVARLFGRCRRIHVVDAGWSIVTRRPEELHVRQRFPHVDA